MHDTFAVTHFDPTTGRGTAQQTANASGQPLYTEQFGFDTGVGNGICEYFLDGEESGVRSPSEAIAQRIPTVGTAIMGFIAHESTDNTTAIGEDGLPFLRNWFYEDQHDEVIANKGNDTQVDTEEDLDPEDYDQFDMDGGFGEEDDYPREDDYVTPDMILARARRAIRNPEAAAEAARTCPGDFVY